MELRNEEGLTESEFLAQYKPGHYERPSVTVDMLVFAVNADPDGEEEVELLLIRRKNHPCIGQWAIPGGFVNMDESLEEAAARELLEETGLTGVSLEQLHSWGDVKRDPRTRIISVSYMAVVPKESLVPRAGDDASEALWFQVGRQKLSDLENGFTYAITVENEERAVFMNYRITELFERRGLMWKKDVHAEVLPAIGIPDYDEIAFDHIYMIHMALDRLEEMRKEYREDL